MGLGETGRPGQTGGRRYGGPGPERRDFDAGAGRVEAPPVIGALQHVLVAPAQRQGSAPVRATVLEGHDPPTGPVEHPGLAEEHDPEWLRGHFRGAGHGMPAPSQGRIDVGERARGRFHVGG